MNPFIGPVGARHALPLHRYRVMSPSSRRGAHRCRANPHRYPVTQPSPSRARMVRAIIGKCFVTGIECDHRDRYGTPGHVTVVMPWRTSLRANPPPPLSGDTTVAVPCPDGRGDHREMFGHRDRMRSSGPVRYTGSCHRRHAVAHIVAAQIPTVTRSHNRHRPPSGSPPDHRMMIFPTFRFSRIR